jgi:hypothetical protein
MHSIWRNQSVEYIYSITRVFFVLFSKTRRKNIDHICEQNCSDFWLIADQQEQWNERA